MTDIVPTHAPSAWTIQNILSTAQSAVARLRQSDATIDSDEDALALALAEEGADVDDILRRLIRAHLEATAVANAATARIKDLQQRKKRYALRALTWRQTAFAVMEALGKRRFIDAEFTAQITARSGKVQPEYDVDLLPPEYVITERKPDREKIEDDAANGVVIPGRIVPDGDNGGETITIKTVRTK